MIVKQISHYRVDDKLGGGGMGVVYLAKDLKLDREVALKFLPPQLSNDRERNERFVLEAKAASALDHPNIGTIYEVNETDDGQLFIAMAYYKGETLKKRVSEGPVSVDEAVDIAVQIARGLRKVHAEDIIHRDIKPANVILTEDGLAKIVDFGLAKLVSVTSITGSGDAMGTPAYMSPEQTRESAVEARTDLWSLGVLLFEMVTGEPPFKGGHAQAVVLSILNDEPSWEVLRERAPNLEPILQRAFQKDPDKRYQSASEFLSDLQGDVSASDVTHARRAEALPAKQRKLGVAVTAVVLGLALAAGVFAWWSSEQRMERALETLAADIEADNLDAVSETLQAAELDLNSSRMDELATSIAGSLSVTTEPPGISVEAHRVSLEEDFFPIEPLVLGTTPISRHRLVAGEYLLRFARSGFAPVELLVEIEVGGEIAVARTLLSTDIVPEGMVYVPEGTGTAIKEGVVVPAFFIDRHEVTNSEFLEFVSAGGYRNASLWPDTLVIDGAPKPRSEAIEEFTDRTGIAGPRDWSGGTYPDGRADHPVVGVSWYEASAYAMWKGKELPSWERWWRAALGDDGEVFPWGTDVRANFSHVGTRPVGSYPLGMSSFGGYDFAGNVREWLRAPVGDRRQVVGGSWLDPDYMFEPTHAESFDPAYVNEAIGFRCTKLLDE